MEIKKIFVVKKGLTRTEVNVMDIVLPYFECDFNDKVQRLPQVSEGDVFYLDTNHLNEELIPTRTFKWKTKEPEKIQIDILLVIENNRIETKPIRFKQPNPKGKRDDKRVRIEIPKIEWEYSRKTKEQIEQWYSDTEKDGLSGFDDLEDFLDWYEENVQDKKCGYCQLSERDCQSIIHKGLLTSLRFPIYKNTSQGVNRGYWLEIDRKNPIGLYSRENCIPSCYFCNNDKSDVFNEVQYREFMTDRIGFVRRILNEND
jgi:hypothetical protein